MSMNDLGWDNLTAAKTPLVVVVASSTGDGDPPDNAAAAYVAMKKSWPADRLAGVKFTVLGLGDSNYTRFMHVSRGIKSRFQDLGATCFYACAEADEVDGLEATVDPWCEGIIQPLQAALKQLAQPAAAADAAAAEPRGSTPAGSAAGSRPPSGVLAGEQSTALLAAVSRGGEGGSSAVGDDDAAAGACVQMELSAVSGESGLLSGGASLLGEGSINSVAAAAADSTAAAAAATLAAAPADTASSRRSTASARSDAGPAVKLVNGLAPAGVDLKGVPPLAPCRIAVNQQVSPAVAAAAREREVVPTMQQKFYRDPSGNYSAAAPFWATVSDARLLTADSSDRTVIHVELDVADSGMRFAAGDAVGLLPQNAAPLVTGLLARLGLDGDSVFEVTPASGEATGQGLLSHVPWPCSLRHAFSHCTDLTSPPRKSLLRLLAEHCSDEDEARTLLFLASKAGREAYGEEITRGQPSVLDLLRRFPSCSPPLDALLDALPPMAPRMYSLTNAPVAGPAATTADSDDKPATAAAAKGVPGAVGASKVQFALSVVEFETQYGTRHGVASNWLARLVRSWLAGEVGPGTDPLALPQVWVPLFLRRAGDFHPPRSLSTPMVMIGPGTGVAPFRGFLQQRLADMQASGTTTPAPAVLYFGCRRADEDYLYEQDWADLSAAGALQTLRVAFSRAQQHKVYVQHLIKEDSRSVAKLIAEGAHVYVCGDGAAMAKDVHATLLALLRDEMGLSEGQAADELTAMAKAGRYVRDIWS
ncbi:hypothetical protein OEZ86_001057 [Tetradesmus obliquus]|nr:hypothetical protein OEZ86_001057 [Tetradesmus obliquus]